MTNAICPECGLAVDPLALRESGFPWAHRRQIGRLRAYWRTVWWVIINSRKLSMETAKPQLWADARAFQRVTVGLTMVLILIAMAVAVFQFDAYDAIILQEERGFFIVKKIGAMLDVLLPWSAGVVTVGVLPICVGIFVVQAFRAQQALFDPKFISDAKRSVGLPIAVYAISPIVLLWPAAMLWGVWLSEDFINDYANRFAIRSFLDSFFLYWLALGFTALAILLSVVRTLQWWWRVTRSGVGGTLLAALRWGVAWLLTAVIWLGVVPWCAGLVRVAIESMRD